MIKERKKNHNVYWRIETKTMFNWSDSKEVKKLKDDWLIV